MKRDAPSSFDFALRAMQGHDIAVGRAKYVSDDADGNPLYDIAAVSMFSADNKVVLQEIKPFRVYEGVKVVAIGGEVLCLGFRVPFEIDTWIWLVRERIDWGDCPP